MESDKPQVVRSRTVLFTGAGGITAVSCLAITVGGAALPAPTPVSFGGLVPLLGLGLVLTLAGLVFSIQDWLKGRIGALGLYALLNLLSIATIAGTGTLVLAAGSPRP